MAIASLAGQAAGVGMSSVGKYYAAKGDKYSLRLQAKLDEINARMSEGAARDSLARGERAEQSRRLETGKLKSAQRVSLAANGVDLTSDTANDILTTTDLMGEIDADTIKVNAMREAWGHRMDAGSLRSSAASKRASAKAISPGMALAGGLLTGAASIGTSYYGMKESGALGKSADRWEARGDKLKSWF